MKLPLRTRQAALKAARSKHHGHFTEFDPHTGEIYEDGGVYTGRIVHARVDSIGGGAVTVTGPDGSTFAIDVRTGEPIARYVGDHTVVDKRYK